MAAEETAGADGGARAAILEATERLLQDRTLDDLNVADILIEAGISRATFYFYFSNKDDAFLRLLEAFMSELVARFEEILGDVERRRSPALREDIAGWLGIEPPHQVIARAAIAEWPRRPDLRAVFLAGQARMAEVLTKAIDADRRAGVALKSIPSAQLASGWIWTMERSWYEALGGGGHLRDLPAVNDALAATLVAAVYGS
jgi:AcrR family transcriptional regulator